MNEYVGKICPYCKAEFKEGDEIVVCSTCDMPHHKECWVDNQGCTTFGCLGTIKSPDGSKTTVTTSEIFYEDSTPSQNVVYCTRCGAQNQASSSFCSKCGNRLNTPTQSTPPHFTPSGSNNANPYGYVSQQNTYQQYQSYTNQGYSSNSNGNISTFIGAKTEYYIPKFNQMKVQNKKSSWNWCSFLFAPYWFIYRKMYGYGAATLGGMFLLNLIGGWFLSLLSLAAYIVFGIMGNYIYMQQVEKHTAQYNMLTEPMKSQYLSKNSGTNTTATVLTIIGYAILIGIIQAV